MCNQRTKMFLGKISAKPRITTTALARDFLCVHHKMDHHWSCLGGKAEAARLISQIRPRGSGSLINCELCKRRVTLPPGWEPLSPSLEALRPTMARAATGPISTY